MCKMGSFSISGTNYVIKMHVVLEFGVDLAKTAGDIQAAVREQVNRMTSKTVARVDVNIDDVKPAIVKDDDDEDAEETHSLD